MRLRHTLSLLALLSSSVLSGQIRVNVGGPQYTDTAGNVWAADNGCTSTSTYTYSGSITGTLDPTLYQTGRTATSTIGCSYTVPASAYYIVTLKFAEYNPSVTAATNGPGANPRLMNVLINGVRYYTALNIRQQCGFATACDIAPNPIPVNSTSTGAITIQITQQQGQPMLAALEIDTLNLPLGFLTLSGIPEVGQVPTATSTTTANWQYPCDIATCDFAYSSLTVACAAATAAKPLLITRNTTIPAGNFSCLIPNNIVIYGGVTVSISGVNSKWSLDANQTVTCLPGGGAKNTTAHGSVFLLNAVTNTAIKGCTIVASNGAPVQPTAYTDGIGITLTGGSADITIDSCDISGHENAGILLDNVTYYTLTNNKFHDGVVSSVFTNWQYPGHEIAAYGTANNGTVTNNKMISYNDMGFGCEPFQTISSTCNDNNISHNTIKNKNYVGVILYGKVANVGQTVLRNRINYNEIDDIFSRVGAGGIPATTQGGDAIYNTSADFTDIIGNHTQNTQIGRSGVTLPWGTISQSDSLQVRILDNEIVDSHFYGIWASNNGAADSVGTQIARNKLSTIANAGVVTQNTHVSILNNTISGTGGQCVLLDALTTHPLAAGNTCTAAGGTGIQSTSPSALIIANTVETAQTYGYAVSGNDSIVNSNIARANSQAAASTYDGFHFTGTSGLQAAGNSAYDDQGSPTQYAGYRVESSYFPAISAATNANPVRFTTAAAPASSTVVTIRGATAGWATANMTCVSTRISATVFSCPLDSTAFGALSGSLTWSDGTVSLTNNQGRGNTGGLWAIASSVGQYHSVQNQGLADSVVIASTNNSRFINGSANTGVPVFNCQNVGELYIRTDITGLYICSALPATWTLIGPTVTSFNGRTGAVTLTSGDVTTALGFSPVQSFNSRTGVVTLTSGDVTTALTFTPANAASNTDSATTGISVGCTGADSTHLVCTVTDPGHLHGQN